jgi:hypothetical protein
MPDSIDDLRTDVVELHNEVIGLHRTVTDQFAKINSVLREILSEIQSKSDRD